MKDPGRIASVLALVFVCVIQWISVSRLAPRKGMDDDEVEFLHGALRLAHGERLYVDFAEHHPPFVFRALAAIAPANSGDQAQVDRYVLRARLASSFLGAVAVGAAAFLLWRATHAIYAPAIFIAVLLASPTLWDRAFSDVRGEPPALALFWIGALLILGVGDTPARRVTFGGIGVGLIALSCIINPKWPLASVALGLIFVITAARAGRSLFARGMIVGAASVVAVLLLFVVTVDPRQYVDFVFLQSRAIFVWWTQHLPQAAVDTGPFFHCPAELRPIYVIPAAVVVTVVAATIRDAYRNAGVVCGVIALLLATLLEIRFIYPWPLLWVQYYILWGIAGAAVYALLPTAIVAAVRHAVPRIGRFAGVVPVVLTLSAILRAPDVLPPPGTPDPAVVKRAAVAAALRPDDTVWLGVGHHPLGAHDASYYWFGFGDFVPGALAFARTPRGARVLPPIGEDDLPPCRLERGLEPHLRFITGGEEIAPLRIVSGCIDRLRARGVVSRTQIHNVFIVGAPRR